MTQMLPAVQARGKEQVRCKARTRVSQKNCCMEPSRRAMKIVLSSHGTYRKPMETDWRSVYSFRGLVTDFGQGSGHCIEVDGNIPIAARRHEQN